MSSLLLKTRTSIKKYPYVFLLVGILLFSVVAGIVMQNNNENTPNSDYQYAQTSKYLLPGVEKGRGMSFLKPDSYILVGQQSSTDASFVNLNQSNNINSSSGAINAQISNFPTKTGPSDEFIKAVNETVKNKSSEGYQAVVGALEDFANEAFPEPELKASLSTGTPFSSNNIPKNAWVFDVTVSSSDDSKASPQTGKLIYALGANTKYMFLVSANTSEWQNNQSYFNNILNSVAIDQ